MCGQNAAKFCELSTTTMALHAAGNGAKNSSRLRRNADFFVTNRPRVQAQIAQGHGILAPLSYTAA